jgi:hypothetical protein
MVAGGRFEVVMAEMSACAVLGFRPHTYWTAVVALAGELSAPRVVGRRRVEFAAGQERFVYHQVAEMDSAAAQIRIAQARVASREKASRGIAEAVTALRTAGLDVRLAVVPTGRAKAERPLAEIVKSHALIHAAEGDFYRDVVAEACVALGLEVSRLVERDLLLEASRTLGVPAVALEDHLKAMGRAFGPPWSEDQKLATLAAWTGMADLSG